MIAEKLPERGTLMLDFRVETFLAVCRHMNFTRAARELSITQPAVSHHIRYLEQAYGAVLFRHNGKRLQLTEAGEILRRTLLTMKHDEQHLQKRMQQAATGTRVIFEYYLRERGLAAADFARTVEIGNIGAIKTLLKSGYGVSFLYRAAIRPEEAAGTLSVIELSDFQLRHDIMFLFPKNSNFRADYTTIFQELRACAQPDGACACPEA